MTRKDICISIGHVEFSELMKMLKSISVAEIRLDLMDLSPDEAWQVFSSHNNLIATCRPGKYSDNERFQLLEKALVSGAAFVDIEIESHNAETEKIISLAKKLNRKVLISFHSYDKTPDQKELDKIVNSCFGLGADIAKIACLVNSSDDNSRLMALYWKYKNIIVLGMGENSMISRLSAPFLGAPFTYAGTGKSKTAPGQPDYKDVEAFFQLIELAGQ